MAAKLPMKFRILHLMSKNESLSEQQILEELRKDYGSERQCRHSVIEFHLQNMRAVGMIQYAELSLDENGKLKKKYKITDFGTSRLKYLPRGFEKKV